MKLNNGRLVPKEQDEEWQWIVLKWGVIGEEKLSGSELWDES